jgi:hypothetical protein
MIYIWDNGEKEIEFLECELKPEHVIPYLDTFNSWIGAYTIGVVSLHKDVNLQIKPLWHKVFLKPGDASEDLMHYTFIMYIRNGLPKGFITQYTFSFLKAYRAMLDKSELLTKSIIASDALHGDSIAVNVLWDMVIE